MTETKRPQPKTPEQVAQEEKLARRRAFVRKVDILAGRIVAERNEGGVTLKSGRVIDRILDKIEEGKLLGGFYTEVLERENKRLLSLHYKNKIPGCARLMTIDPKDSDQVAGCLDIADRLREGEEIDLDSFCNFRVEREGPKYPLW